VARPLSSFKKAHDPTTYSHPATVQIRVHKRRASGLMKIRDKAQTVAQKTQSIALDKIPQQVRSKTTLLFCTSRARLLLARAHTHMYTRSHFAERHIYTSTHISAAAVARGCKNRGRLAVIVVKHGCKNFLRRLLWSALSKQRWEKNRGAFPS
jgi:hypothetical protein